MSSHDYILVGAGIAGCVLANRLSADPGVSVLLLETGPDASADPKVTTPSRWPELMDGDHDWGYRTTPQPGLRGRRVRWPRGRLVGGSSSLHAMVYVRGHHTDFDAWARCGGARWSYESLAPHFARAEHDGVSVTAQRSPHPLAEAFVAAGRQLGYPVHDKGVVSEHGVGLYPVMQRDGRRDSAADAYLAPAAHRPNLTVLPGTRVLAVTFAGNTATGVRISRAGREVELHARREVILCAGTIGSPHLLLLSGIGPAADLRAAGVTPRLDLPGVGANLHDHVQVSVGFRTTTTSPVPATSNLGEAGGFVTLDPAAPAPQLQLSFAPMLDLNDGHDFGQGFTIGPAVTRPRSRGRLTLTSADPWEPPSLDPGYLLDRHDVDVLVEGVRIALALGNAPALARHTDPAHEPATGTDLERYVRDHAQTQFHPVGTCRLGTDERAVVDPDLRVHGTAGLRVVDASVIPEVTTGNISAPVFALAEAAAARITAGLPIPV